MIDIALPVQLDKLSEQRAGLLPTSYWCRGNLFEHPTVGRTLRLARYERARQHPDEVEPVKVIGLYVSSPVQEITTEPDGALVCRTQNSVWRVTQIAPPKEETAPPVSEAPIQGLTPEPNPALLSPS